MTDARYSHGHHDSVLRSHRWRTVENSAAYLAPYLRSGASLLDVGCGPGTITIDLAQRVSPGRVVGVDSSASVVDEARRWSQQSSVSVEFEVGSVYDLDFEDESFDVVHAHQVLQHLGDPVSALREMGRVLRTGGLLAVRDADYGAFVWWPRDPRLDRWLDIYHRITLRNGAEADAGRYLPSWARDAGFESVEVSSSNWVFHSEEDRRWWGSLWADRVRQSEFARQGIEYGVTDEAELAGIAEAFLEWADSPDGVFVVVNVEILARRRDGLLVIE